MDSEELFDRKDENMWTVGQDTKTLPFVCPDREDSDREKKKNPSKKLIELYANLGRNQLMSKHSVIFMHVCRQPL